MGKVNITHVPECLCHGTDRAGLTMTCIGVLKWLPATDTEEGKWVTKLTHGVEYTEACRQMADTFRVIEDEYLRFVFSCPICRARVVIERGVLG